MFGAFVQHNTVFFSQMPCCSIKTCNKRAYRVGQYAVQVHSSLFVMLPCLLANKLIKKTNTLGKQHEGLWPLLSQMVNVNKPVF